MHKKIVAKFGETNTGTTTYGTELCVGRKAEK
jgi:hypothetical protein